MKTAFVDWKEDAENILFALRETFREEFPAIMNEEYDALCENYANEETEDVLRALGQELSLNHYFLYSLEEDSDSYCLALTSEENAESFLSELKSRKRKATKLLQPRRKEGTAAKRIDLGKRLPCKSYDLPRGFQVTPQDLFEDMLLLETTASDESAQSCLMNIDRIPPTTRMMPRIIRRMVKSDTYYAAILVNPQLNAKGQLKDNKSYICIGSQLENLSDWKTILTDDSGDSWEDIFWHGNDLFLAGMSTAAFMKDAAKGDGKLNIVLTSKESKLTFPKFFERNGNLYLYMQGTFYGWTKGGFLKKEGFHKKIYTIPEETISEIIPVGNAEIAFFCRPVSSPRSRERITRQIIVLNMENGKTKTFSCPGGNLCRMGTNQIGILYNSYNGAKLKKGDPILTCMDLTTGKTTSPAIRCTGYGRAVGSIPDGIRKNYFQIG